MSWIETCLTCSRMAGFLGRDKNCKIYCKFYKLKKNKNKKKNNV